MLKKVLALAALALALGITTVAPSDAPMPENCGQMNCN